MSVIQECWINGMAIRKMMRVFNSFGIVDISASQVSHASKDLGSVDIHFQHKKIVAK